jgi:hypothetical protein
MTTAVELAARIEALMVGLLRDFVLGESGGALVMVRRTAVNAVEDALTGAIVLGDLVTERRLAGRSAVPFARVIAVLSVVHWLLRNSVRKYALCSRV